MNPGRIGILTDALTAIARLIMEARSDRDADAIVHQLRALGQAARADVDGIEAARREELAIGPQHFVAKTRPLDTSPTETTTGRLYRQPLAPDFPGDLDGGE